MTAGQQAAQALAAVGEPSSAWLEFLQHGLAAAHGLDGTTIDAPPCPAPQVLGDAASVRPRATTGCPLPRSVQHGRQRRGPDLRHVVPARAEAPDARLQAAARDRRAGDDGQHHRRDHRQAMGLHARHDAATLGRVAPRDDGRGAVCRSRRRLALAGARQLHVVARPEHADHGARAPRGAVLHRAGADAAPRQALRVGDSRRRPGRPSRSPSRTTTGPTKCCMRASASSGTSRRCPARPKRCGPATARGRRC